ncbi:MAG: hypothetical protein U9Q70_04875 [Chloroflexota bacterium]|nr:hypothetical protein [Chloroflexota bacterium]
MKTKSLLLALMLSLIALPVYMADGGPGLRYSTDLGGEGGDGSVLFIENVGQFDARARFQVRGGAGTLWLTEDALWLTLIATSRLESTGYFSEQSQTEPYPAVNLKLSFADANPHPRLEPFNRLDSVVHYYRGNDPAQWRTNVPVWGGVRYVDIYPGVDLEVTGENGRWVWRSVCSADCESALRQKADCQSTLPATLIPCGAPAASSGPAPVIVGQTLTWAGDVFTDTTVTLTYAAELTSTTTLTPTIRNLAQIDDGVGNVYTRSAFVNWKHIYLPLVLRNYAP